MKCFYHHGLDAVGSCKSCGKGLCPGCAADVGGGLACERQCEDQVRALNRLANRSIRLAPMSEHVYGRYSRGQFMAAGFAIVAGGIFIMLGLDLHGTGRLGVTGIGLLVVFLGIWQGFAGVALRRASRQRGDNGPPSQ